jgi:hypothetical protein
MPSLRLTNLDVLSTEGFHHDYGLGMILISCLVIVSSSNVFMINKRFEV